MADLRKNIMLGTAGHVDHGKTALVKLLTGCDTDRLAEEKRRGLTIELGFAPCCMADKRIVGIVDVPGHVSFIRHMVAGAHGVDVMILVVAADDGVMPQTREHLDVLTLMGARRGVIALTKIDLVDDETRDLAAQEVRAFVEGTFLAEAPLCPVSNLTGEGFDAFFAALDGQVAACPPRYSRGPYRQWVERSFVAHGYGLVASGIPSAGQTRVGDHLRVLPGERVSRVRHLQVYGHDTDAARAGECAAVNLADVALADVPRGALLTNDESLQPTLHAAARLHVLPRSRRALKDGAQVHLHIGTAHVQAVVAALEGRPLEPGTQALVQLRLDRPLPLTPGDRFVLRAHVEEEGGLTTIGGGRVLDARDGKLRRKRPEVLERLRHREAALDDAAAWCLALLEEAGAIVGIDELAGRCHLTGRDVGPIIERLQGSGDVILFNDGRVAARRTLEQAGRRVVEHLQQAHTAEPDQLGVNAAGVAAALGLEEALFAAVLQQLIEAGRVVRAGDLLSLADHRPRMNDGELRLLDAVVDAYRTDHTTPRRPADVAAALGESPKRVARMIDMLVGRGDLVRLSDQVIMHRDAVAAAEAVVRSLFDGRERFSTAEFRDALGASRKYVIPLLDHFDRVRLTIRHGSERAPGARLRSDAQV